MVGLDISGQMVIPVIILLVMFMMVLCKFTMVVDNDDHECIVLQWLVHCRAPCIVVLNIFRNVSG